MADGGPADRAHALGIGHRAAGAASGLEDRQVELAEPRGVDNGWVVEVAGEFAGWVQYEEEPYEWYPSVALDIALTTSLHGSGYGRRALRLAIGHFVAKGHHRFTIDPDVRNERAIRSYAGGGFKPVGVLRSHGRNPEGAGTTAC